MKSIEIVPGTSIGPLKMGMLESDLPQGAAVGDAGVGSLDHVSFTLEGGRVHDVWIDQLDQFPYQLILKGQKLSRPPTLAELQSLAGSCARVPDIIGGIFYNCQGVTLGCDRTNRITQVRLKPR